MTSNKDNKHQDHYVLNGNESLFGDKTSYTLRVKDLDKDEKPREKLILGGPSSLSVAELLAVLLAVGTKKEEVLTMSSRILREYGERAVINESDPQRLSKTLQIPLPKACQIVSCFELGRRYYEKKYGKAVFITSAQQAFDHLKDMAEISKEQLRGLYLNSRYKLIYEEVISIGSLTTGIIHPREVFKPAYENNAAAILIAHNHPSGNLEPTYADKEASERLLVASKILGIELIDHLIIATNGFRSVMKD